MKTRGMAVLGLAVIIGVAACEGGDREGETARDAAPDTTPPPEVTPPVMPGEPEELELPAEELDAGEGADDARGEPPAARDEQPAAPAPRAEERSEGEPRASEILDRVERRYSGIESIQARFVQRVDVRLLDEERTSRGTLYQRRPNLFAMRFSDPQGDVVVADGRHLWMYHPSVDERQVMRSRLGDGTGGIDFHREFLQRAEERFSVEHGGTATVQGRRSDILVMRPREASPYRRVRIWIDREDALVRRFEITEENGNVRLVELTDIDVNVRVPDGVFRFEPPPQARVYDQ